MPPAPALALAHVSRRHGSVAAVDDVSFTVERGEFFSLLGPSGCGKTTTLRMIAGFEDPEPGGSIHIQGEPMIGRRPYQRPIGMVFQNYAIFPHLTVAGNIAFGLEEHGVPKPAIRERVHRALELVRLDPIDFASRRPASLSGGQRQRVALARALVLEPPVLLLDEPLAALDLQLRKAMQLELKQLNRTLGISFVLVTHDQEEALAMSDRIAVMSGGRIVQVGTPEDVYRHPRTAFVAQFIGQANIIDGVAVRPEWHQLVAPDAVPAGMHVRTGRILEVVFLGDARQVIVEIADGTVLRVAQPSPRSAGDAHGWRAGDTVAVTWRPDDAQVLEG